MNWDSIKLAYTPYSKDFSAPGDRRRFIFYVNERKIRFEIADPLKKYDIVYLTYGCNIDTWIDYKKNNPEVKFIFELIDSYLLEGISLLTLFRGVTRFLLGKESSLWINYKTALRKMVTMVDAVVCSTHAQKADLLRFNNNIHISLDYFSNDLVRRKNSLKSNNKFKLVWEGQAYTVDNLLLLNDVFSKLGDKFELFIITDSVIKSPIRIFDKKTSSVLTKLKCKYTFLNWDKSSFSENIANADLSIIPISSNNPMMWNKPENKLLLLWEIGIPTLTSETPAYKRVMDVAGINFYCSSSSEWVRKIEEYMNSSIEYRKSIVQKAKDYLLEFHSKEKILKNWDDIFDSLQISLEK
jgi:hypothetical protein